MLYYMYQSLHTYSTRFVNTRRQTAFDQETYCNCCIAICLLTVVYLLPIVCVAIFYGQFLFLWSVIFRATYANPQPAFFRVTNI